jgi:hypothetical protein
MKKLNTLNTMMAIMETMKQTKKKKLQEHTADTTAPQDSEDKLTNNPRHKLTTEIQRRHR